MDGARSLAPITRALTLAVLAMACSGKILADDRVAHATVNVTMCRGCHGIARYRTAYPEVYSVPKLGGQQGAYIVKALQDYKSGLRTHATMRSIAATLSDQEITAIAAYYAGNGK
jgi:cytochrome c553